MSNFQPYQRKEVAILLERLAEIPRTLTVIAGTRQVGKTTVVRDVLQQFPRTRYRFIAVDQPDDNTLGFFDGLAGDTFEQDAGVRDAAWLVRQWQRARQAARKVGQEQAGENYILVLDEIQKSTVGRKW